MSSVFIFFTCSVFTACIMYMGFYKPPQTKPCAMYDVLYYVYK